MVSEQQDTGHALAREMRALALHFRLPRTRETEREMNFFGIGHRTVVAPLGCPLPPIWDLRFMETRSASSRLEPFLILVDLNPMRANLRGLRDHVSCRIQTTVTRPDPVARVVGLWRT